MMTTLVRGCAARQPTAALATRTRTLQQQQQCFLWVKVQEGQDSSRVASRMQTILAEDGTLKTLALKRFHEKKWQKRKRNDEEQTIRRANRRVGSMIDFILRRKKAGY